MRPLAVREEGSIAVGRNTESCKEIHRRSKRTIFLTERRLDRLRPLPVGDKGSNAVGKNTESCEEIYRRSKRKMFLTENVSEGEIKDG